MYGTRKDELMAERRRLYGEDVNSLCSLNIIGVIKSRIYRTCSTQD